MNTEQLFSDFGSFLRELRVKSGLSQKDLADKIGCAKQPLSLWENNRTFPGKKLLKKISEVFQVSCDELLFMHKQRRATRIQNLILQSRDPVVMTIKPCFVSILDKNIKPSVLVTIQSLQKSKCRRFYLPMDIPAESVFAFEISDNQMSPYYHDGDIVLVDMRRKPRDGEPVVIKAKGRSPICRIYFDGFGVKILKAAKPKSLVMEISAKNIDWCYAIMNPVKE